LLLGLVLASLWRRSDLPRRRLWLLTLVYLGLVAVSTPAIVFLAVGTLEWAYPPRYDVPEGTQAIVVLGGRVDPADAVRPQPELGNETAVRCLKAAQLYRDGGRRLVAVSGGNADPDQIGPTCAEAMASLLENVGVSPGDLVYEGASLSTYENAVETRNLLEPRGVERIVLVTSATHLWRSELCFRKQGFQVTPRGSNYRATEFRWSLRAFLPSAEAADTMDAVVHEWIGLAWYWMKGRI
jgi:uncharacterized SAM-binding protein YcdF (DUF218 family)